MFKCAKIVALAVFASGATVSIPRSVALDEHISRNLTLSPELAGTTPLAYLGLTKTAAGPAFTDTDQDLGADHDHDHVLPAMPGPMNEGSFEV